MSSVPAPAKGATSPIPAESHPKEHPGPVRLIRARRGAVGLDVAELWRYRELFGFLVWRDILVRYKQTYLGIAWAVVQPLLYMLVFTALGHAAKFPNYGVPYPLISLAGLLPWQFFSTALTDSSNSLLTSSNMISKVYFPRLIVPSGAVLSGTVDFLASFVLFLVFELCYRMPIRVELLLIPFFFLYAVLAALSAGVWLSALSVRYRDVKYIVPFLTRIGLIACPLAFPSTVIPERWRLLYSLNPVASIIDGFRWCALGPAFAPKWEGLGLSFLLTLVVLGLGLAYFRSTERRFADLI
ncbi:MAG TPA: ABC transporter permease [Chthoniobacteraceae bacterium]|jgi:lipopolysaccharide transport system permease protein|nr:ABC transporter permease [Chthoniobacteraceae bacterium]